MWGILQTQPLGVDTSISLKLFQVNGSNLSSSWTPKNCPHELELPNSKDHYSLKEENKKKTDAWTWLLGNAKRFEAHSPYLQSKDGKHLMEIIKTNKTWCLLRTNNLPGIALSILTLDFNKNFEILVLLLFPFLRWENWGTKRLTNLPGIVLTVYQSRNGNYYYQNDLTMWL